MDFSDETLDKFLERFDSTPTCWYWRGPFNEKGYGIFRYSLKGVKYKFYAHRYSYTLYVETIPYGYDTHHECEVQACVNPEHLVLKTTSEHRLDHVGETCPQGHPYFGANLYMAKNGARVCRACKRDWARRNYRG